MTTGAIEVFDMLAKDDLRRACAEVKSDISGGHDKYIILEKCLILKEAGFHEHALTLMKDAFESYPREPAFFYEAAVLESALGKDRQARKLLQRALAINPSFTSAFRALTRSYAADRDDASFHALVKRHAPHLPPAAVTEAFQSLASPDGLRRGLGDATVAEPDTMLVNGRTHRNSRSPLFDEAPLPRRDARSIAAKPETNAPPAVKFSRLLLSVGAMKAGTSWLFKQLERHPSIETTPVKEIHYFAHTHTPFKFIDDAARIINFKSYARECDFGRDVAVNAKDAAFFSRYLAMPIDENWYRNLFLSDDDCFKADFSNMTCVLDGSALTHIRTIADEVRLIYILRDPLARLWSHVKFHAALNDQLHLISRLSCDEYETYFVSSGAAAQSDYAFNIARMRRYFSSRELKVVYFEDFLTTPRSILNEIFEFLGVAPQNIDVETLRQVHNPGPIMDCPPAFIQAARNLLTTQPAALEKLGVVPHDRWDLQAIA